MQKRLVICVCVLDVSPMYSYITISLLPIHSYVLPMYWMYICVSPCKMWSDVIHPIFTPFRPIASGHTPFSSCGVDTGEVVKAFSYSFPQS